MQFTALVVTHWSRDHLALCDVVDEVSCVRIVSAQSARAELRLVGRHLFASLANRKRRSIWRRCREPFGQAIGMHVRCCPCLMSAGKVIGYRQSAQRGRSAAAFGRPSGRGPPIREGGTRTGPDCDAGVLWSDWSDWPTDRGELGVFMCGPVRRWGVGPLLCLYQCL